MNASRRGFMSFALASVLSLSCILPAYAEENAVQNYPDSDKTQQMTETADQSSPPEDMQPKAEEKEDDTGNTPADSGGQEDFEFAGGNDSSQTEILMPEGNVSARNDSLDTDGESSIQTGALTITGSGIRNVSIKENQNLARQMDDKIDQEITGAWELSQPISGSYTFTTVFDQDGDYTLYDVSQGSPKELKSFSGNKLSLDVLDLSAFVIARTEVRKEKAVVEENEIQPRAPATATYYLKRPGETSFAQIKQVNSTIGSQVADTLPDDTEAPQTLTYNNQLYMRTLWYDDANLSRVSIFDILHSNAGYYATYVPAVQMTLQNLVNSTDSGALSKSYTYSIAETTNTKAGVIVDDGVQKYPQLTATTNITGNGQVSFYVPLNDSTATSSVEVSVADYSGSGFKQYVRNRNKRLEEQLSSGALEPGISGGWIGDNRLIFVNSHEPYVPQNAYTYGEYTSSKYFGLGMAKLVGPEVIDGALLSVPSPQLNYLNQPDVTIEYPDTIQQTPATSSIQFYAGYPILNYQNREWKYASTPEEQRMNGYYQLNWTLAVLSTGANAGDNRFFKVVGVGTRCYHLDGEITFNPDRNIDIVFKVKEPGATSFTDVAGHATAQIGAGQTLDDATFPTTTQLPATRTVNGVEYTLESWYSNESLTTPIDRTQRLVNNTTIYAAYVPVQYECQLYVMDPDASTYRLISTSHANNGTSYADLTASADRTLQNPIQENKNYWIQSAWYTDEACTQKVTGTEKLQSNVRLYKKYVPASVVTVRYRKNPPDMANLTGTYRFTSTTSGLGIAIPKRDPNITFNRTGDGDYSWNVSTGFSVAVNFYIPENTTWNFVQDSDFTSDGCKTYLNVDNTITETREVRNQSAAKTVVVITAKEPYASQSVYTYGQLPNGQKVGLGMSSASAGPLLSPGNSVNVKNNFMDFDPTITLPATDPVFPDIEYEGKTYQYAASNSSQASLAGYYTIPRWDSLKFAGSVDTGSNNFFTPGNKANFRLIGKLHLNLYYNITFKVKEPKAQTFTDTNEKLLENAALDTVAPTMSNMQVDGITYVFKGWFSDEAMTHQVDLNQTVSSDTTLYASYVPQTEVFTLTSENVDGNQDANPDDTFTYEIEFTPPADGEPVVPGETLIPGPVPNSYSVTLKGGESVSFNVPQGTQVEVIQTSTSTGGRSYDTAWQFGSVHGSGTATGIQTIMGNTACIFRNTRNGVVPTAYEQPFWLPWLIISAGLILINVAMFTRKRR
ncbi:InlB B-repeat-containing protein [Faecalibaculum rodentium]|uniref:InlB B-repeat-containing protein n=2 Tax=Faecalibaculum rodentium TaxID=1702221 RepID=UPI00266E9BF5|nr:InlB B-repeat-containing protein [Faecalibaculum rodentium]